MLDKVATYIEVTGLPLWSVHGDCLRLHRISSGIETVIPISQKSMELVVYSENHSHLFVNEFEIVTVVDNSEVTSATSGILTVADMLIPSAIEAASDHTE